MSECTTTDKPLISVVMAVYEPRMDWLEEQLVSLNAQTYPHLELLVRDDCSPTTPFESIRELVEKSVTAFPYTLERNEKNLGSNGTFEELTRQARGAAIAYCDQDDIWLPEKLSVLQRALEESRAKLVCSDMFIIDEHGATVADSITKVRRRHVFRSGTGLAPQLLVSNWVSGCAMLVEAKAAKEAVPFCPYMVHDQYLTLCCALRGRVECLPQPLIRYRIHSNNQTLVMSGVTDKNSYVERRIRQLKRRATWLQERFGDEPQLQQTLRELGEWTKARENHMTGQGGAGAVWRYRRYNPLTTLFELAAPLLPEPVFMAAIKLARRNII